MLHNNDLEGRGQNLPEATHPEASNSSHLGHIFLPAESGPVGKTWHRCCRVLLLGPCPLALEGHQPHSSVLGEKVFQPHGFWTPPGSFWTQPWRQSRV